jgi:hypothetical protein
VNGSQSKFLEANSAYIPKSTQRSSLLTWPRSHSYRKSIVPQNRIRNHKNTAEDMCKTMTAKSESKDNSSPNRHFTEHLASVFEELSRESNLNIKTSSFLIRWLKTRPAFTMQVSSPIRKYQTEQQTIGESGKSEKKILDTEAEKPCRKTESEQTPEPRAAVRTRNPSRNSQ